MNYEIERKYLIAMPSEAVLAGAEDEKRIKQTYLLPKGDETVSRVRESAGRRGTVYTYTNKRRISGIRCEETERELTPEEYEALLKNKDNTLRQVEKTRYIIVYEGQRFELDKYPFWEDRAILELELESEEQPVRLPPFIKVIKEVTEDERYKNRAIAKHLPVERV